MGWEREFTVFGVTLILIGFALFFVPIVIKLIPTINVEKIPWFLLYVYRKDGFIFATSPILIIIGIVNLIWAYLHK